MTVVHDAELMTVGPDEAVVTFGTDGDEPVTTRVGDAEVTTSDEVLAVPRRRCDLTVGVHSRGPMTFVQVARKVMSFDSERQVMHFLREETRKFLPEAF